MSDPIDFYKVLGLPVTCTLREIRKRYRKLATKYHPDKLPNNTDPQKRHEYERRFDLISQAFNTLSNENNRKEYDLLYYTQRNIKSHVELRKNYNSDDIQVSNAENIDDVHGFFENKHADLTKEFKERTLEQLQVSRNKQLEPQNVRSVEEGFKEIVANTDIIKIDNPEAITHHDNLASLDNLGDMFANDGNLHHDYILKVSQEQVDEIDNKINLKKRLEEYNKETEKLHNLDSKDYKF
uniref:DnaJ domain protein n=1 Tax=Megaviridae environmental sample TaxID=1737588 RepID=A0A5J6VIV5_9VIRU|nr:MAG: DnaJ domain protein [Megaviridae environmental sample]